MAGKTSKKSYEDVVIGFVILNSTLLSQLVEILPHENYFSDAINRKVYRIFLRLLETGTPLPKDGGTWANTLFEYSQRNNRLNPDPFPNRDSAIRYFTKITEQIPLFSIDDYKTYAQMLRWDYDKKLYKNLLQTKLNNIDFVPFSEREKFVDDTESSMSNLNLAIKGQEELQHISGITGETRDKLNSYLTGKIEDNVIPTGIDSLDYIIGGFAPGEITVLAAQTGGGKALPNSMSIPTPKGYKLVGELKAGDTLFNSKGEPTTILQTHPQKDLQDTYIIEVGDGRRVECSGEHLWTVYDMTPYGVCDDRLDQGWYKSGQDRVKEQGTYGRSKGVLILNTLEIEEALEFSDDIRLIVPQLSSPLKFENESKDGYLLGASLTNGLVLSEERACLVATKIADLDQNHYILRNTPEGYTRYSVILNGGCEEKQAKDLCDTNKSANLDTLRYMIDAFGRISQLGLEIYAPKDLFNNVIAPVIFEQGLSFVHANTEPLPNTAQVRLVGSKQQLSNLVAGTLLQEDFDRTFIYQEEDCMWANEINAVIHTHTKQEMTCFTVDSPDKLFAIGQGLLTHNTALSLVISQNVAIKSKKSVLIFSLEMMNEQLTTRMVSRLGHVDFNALNKTAKILYGKDPEALDEPLSKEFTKNTKIRVDTTVKRAKAALEWAEQLPIYISVEGGVNTNIIRSMIIQKQKELKSKGLPELGLVVIDYLQLLTPADKNIRDSNRTQIVGEMSRTIKQIAKTCSVPILLLSQLSRAADAGEAPELRHLRESGSIEQDADRVLFVWSKFANASADDYEKDYPDPVMRYLAFERDRMPMKIRVAKNRQGASGDAMVLFDMAYSDFVSKPTGDNRSFEEFFYDYYNNTRRGTDLLYNIEHLYSHEIPKNLLKQRQVPYLEKRYIDSSGSVVNKR